MAEFVAILVNIILQTIILAPLLWFVGRKIADPDDVRFTNAMWIIVLGNVISYLIVMFAGGFVGTGILAAFVNLVIWLMLIKHFFDTNWLKAIIISVATVMAFVIVALVLSLIGVGVLVFLS